jgi:hypothetical protein
MKLLSNYKILSCFRIKKLLVLRGIIKDVNCVTAANIIVTNTEIKTQA